MSQPFFEIIDTDDVGWEPDPDIPGFLHKVLHRDPQTGALTQLWYLPPGWGLDGLSMRHYHRTVRERAFTLYGDFPHWEYKRPTQTDGDLVIFRKGFFMDRPPRSIHGLETRPVSQTGCELLYWSTGGDTGVASGGDENVDIPFEGDLQAFGDDFTQARIFDARSLDWESHPSLPGWKRKVLAHDSETGDLVSLIYVPSGWQPVQLPYRGAPATARHWMFALFGDVPIWVYENPNANKGELVMLREGCFLNCFQHSVLGWEVGVVSEIGCLLLDVVTAYT